MNITGGNYGESIMSGTFREDGFLFFRVEQINKINVGSIVGLSDIVWLVTLHSYDIYVMWLKQ